MGRGRSDNLKLKAYGFRAGKGESEVKKEFELPDFQM